MNTICMFLVAVICVIVAPVTGRSQSGGSTKSDADRAAAAQAEVLQLEESGRQKVVKGENNWDDFIAAGAYMIGPDGSVMIYEKGKSFPPFPIKTFTLSDMIARSFGEVVVVTGLGEVTGESPDKKPFIFQMRFINVWRKFPEGWRMVVTERTGVKANNRPPVN